MDEAALKVLQAAEQTKQLLQEKEAVLNEIRREFEQKSKEVVLHHDFAVAFVVFQKLYIMIYARAVE